MLAPERGFQGRLDGQVHRSTDRVNVRRVWIVTLIDQRDRAGFAVRPVTARGCGQRVN